MPETQLKESVSMTGTEALVRAAYAFGKDPKVSNVVSLITPMIQVVEEVKGKTEAEIVEYFKSGIDPLIGSEANALIGGPENPNAPVKFDIPLVGDDGAVLEFASDLALQIIGEEIKKALAKKAATT